MCTVKTVIDTHKPYINTFFRDVASVSVHRFVRYTGLRKGWKWIIYCCVGILDRAV